MTRRSLSSRADRARAATAAIAINLFVGIAFVTGLALDADQQRSDTLETFDVPLPPEPVVEREERNRPAKEVEGAAGRKAEASPIVAEQSPIESPQPVSASPTPGTGAGPSAGAAATGSGAGAGGSGSGAGGGGEGQGGGRVGALLVSGRISNRDYRNIAGSEMKQGSAVFTLLIDTQGKVERCRPAVSSGSGRIDSTICGLLSDRLRFRPAHEADGRPLYQDVNYVARWGR